MWLPDDLELCARFLTLTKPLKCVSKRDASDLIESMLMTSPIDILQDIIRDFEQKGTVSSDTVASFINQNTYSITNIHYHWAMFIDRCMRDGVCCAPEQAFEMRELNYNPTEPRYELTVSMLIKLVQESPTFTSIEFSTRRRRARIQSLTRTGTGHSAWEAARPRGAPVIL